MVRIRKVSIFVCYPVAFEKNVDGDWFWKYVGDEKEQVTKLLSVKTTVPYNELYEMVKVALKIDIELNDFEMKVMAPISKAAPMVIDCDKVVSSFLSGCDPKKDVILVSLKAKEIETEFQGESSVQMEEPDFGTQETSVQMDVGVNDAVNERCDGIGIDEYLVSRENVDVHHCEDSFLLSLGADAILVPQDPPNDALNVGVLNAPVPESGLEGIGLIGLDIVSIPEEVDIQVNELFKAKKFLVYKVEWLAVKHHFYFKLAKSTKSLYVVSCEAEGCKWRLRATKPPNSRRFKVTQYKFKHSCQPIIGRKEHRHASYKLVGRYFCSRFKDGNRTNAPRDLMADFFENFGYEITYDKAHDARAYADSIIRGSLKKSYGKLPKYCHRLEVANPGTFTDIKTKPNDEFLYFFMALGPSIAGFNVMRKVVSVDGTHLKTGYKGVLLVATCQDGNRKLFPIAWGVVDVEDTESWQWFFERLKMITGDTDDVAILSDRHDAIKAGFENVYENAHQGYCTYHMQKNLRTRYPKLKISRPFRDAAVAYTEGEFKICYEKLCGLDSDVKNYLNESTFPYWSRCYSKACRYNIMTTNHAESLNSKLKRAREFSIVGLIEHIRGEMQKWFATRNTTSKNWGALVTPEVEKIIKGHYKKVNRYSVFPIVDNSKYEVFDATTQVRYVVRLDAWNCDCKYFDVHKYPCVHAVAVAKHIGKHAYEYTSHYYSTEYWRKAYAQCVNPLPNSADCEYPEDVLSKVVLPPTRDRGQAGRPSKKRIASAGDAPVGRRKKIKAPAGDGPRRTVQCSKCKGYGHNITTCSRVTVESTPQNEDERSEL